MKEGIFFILWLCSVSIAHGQGIVNTFFSGTISTSSQSVKILPAPNYHNEKLPFSIIPPDFHTLQFGFFCKQELRLQRVNVPFAFRLGSMEHCNILEQKPGYK